MIQFNPLQISKLPKTYFKFWPIPPKQTTNTIKFTTFLTTIIITHNHTKNPSKKSHSHIKTNADSPIQAEISSNNTKQKKTQQEFKPKQQNKQSTVEIKQKPILIYLINTSFFRVEDWERENSEEHEETSDGSSFFSSSLTWVWVVLCVFAWQLKTREREKG